MTRRGARLAGRPNGFPGTPGLDVDMLSPDPERVEDEVKV